MNTLLIHGDNEDEIFPDLAPPLRVSTTFLSENSEQLIYSRSESSNSKKLENTLSLLFQGSAIVYSSGQSALFGLLITLKPKRIICEKGGYHGSQSLFEKLADTLDIKRIYGVNETEFQKGDFIYIESPLNPTCILQDIETISKKANDANCLVCIDSTFAPSPLYYPFKFGVDFIYTSGTKYLGGHSDLLCGIIVSKEDKWRSVLKNSRTIYGNVIGNLECWLLIRSLKTFGLRILKQSENATRLAEWLNSKNIKVWHTSISSHPSYVLGKKYLNGHPGIFSIEMNSEKEAKILPKVLKIFKDATSLGGVESLIEWRYKYDSTISPKLLRVSVGIEDFEDLRGDFQQAFEVLKEIDNHEIVKSMRKGTIEELIRGKCLIEAYQTLKEKDFISKEKMNYEQNKVILLQNLPFTCEEIKNLNINNLLKNSLLQKEVKIVKEESSNPKILINILILLLGISLGIIFKLLK